jgi:glycosyltransferase involved in cell wall biosynthesis
VYPSFYEGFGLPILEAMACGTPVITTNSSSIPEVVGDAAIMVDPHDPDGLADAMDEVLSKEELRFELRRKGLERARSFSWEKTARQTLNVYNEVAKGTVLS